MVITGYFNEITHSINGVISIYWLVVSTPLKNISQISQIGLLFPVHGKIQTDPNHQPVYNCNHPPQRSALECCRYLAQIALRDGTMVPGLLGDGALGATWAKGETGAP